MVGIMKMQQILNGEDTMTEINRKIALEYLNDRWGSYVTIYQGMSAQEQQAFMLRQGYATFADLMAHFTAWWELGMRVIEIKQRDPSYFYPEFDVDEFNAAAVAGAKDLTEAEVLQKFEETRLKFIDCVNHLSEENFRNPNIIRQLDIELVGHLEEHQIKK
jgi:hypothetical protein